MKKLQEEIEELQHQLLGNNDGMISIESKVKKKPFTVNRDQRNVEDGMLWNGERVEVSMETI